MTGGLDLLGQMAVGQALRAALGELGGPGDDAPSVEHASNTVIKLLAVVDNAGGADALFELAACCVELIAGPGRPGRVVHQWMPLEFAGTTGMAGAPEALRADMSRFGTAVLGADRDTAWQVWQPYAPPEVGEPSQDCADFLAGFVQAAWSRHRGGRLSIQVRPGDKWPPTCDFCCHDTASWMWHCRAEDIPALNRPGLPGPTNILLEDMEFWYGCGTCRHLLARNRPDWGQLWAKHRRHRRDADKDSVMTMWRAYAKARKSATPVRLPDVRPTPTRSPGSPQ